MGYYRDHMREMSNFQYKERQAHDRMNKRDSLLPPIGSIDPDTGKLIVGYRSRAGRLGKYLLLSERKARWQDQVVTFVTLGFIGGKPMPDGKTGFDVRDDQIVRTTEEESNHVDE